MSRYHRVSPSYWTTARAWDDKTRVVGVYILTSPHRHTEGLYALPKGYIEADLGYSASAITRSIDILTGSGLVRYDKIAGVVLIPDALETQAPTTVKQIQGAITRLRMVPPSPLLCHLYNIATSHANGLAKAMAEEFAFTLATAGIELPAVPLESSNPHSRSSSSED